MRETDWIYAELLLWIMRSTNTPPFRLPGTTYAAIEDKLAKLEALPPDFELPNIRGIRRHMVVAQERWSDQAPNIPSIPSQFDDRHQRTEFSLGRILAAGIAAAHIDHTALTTDVMSAVRTSLAAHGCCQIPIEDLDACGFLTAGEVLGVDFSKGHPGITNLDVTM